MSCTAARLQGCYAPYGNICIIYSKLHLKMLIYEKKNYLFNIQYFYINISKKKYSVSYFDIKKVCNRLKIQK